jgi:hypothetical protein
MRDLYNRGYVTELEMTYRLLFSPASLQPLSEPDLKMSDEYGILCDYTESNGTDCSVRLDFKGPRAKEALRRYFSMPIPSEHSDPRDVQKHDYKTCPKISSLLDRGAPYSLDMYMHMDSLLKPLVFPERYALRKEEPYSDYPTFANRLRDLKFYVETERSAAGVAGPQGYGWVFHILECYICRCGDYPAGFD